MDCRSAVPIRAALVFTTAVAVAGAFAAPAAAKTSLRIATTTKTVTVGASGNYFANSSYAAATCRKNERAIAGGIVDSPRHIAGQSFGPTVVSGFAVGEPGRVKLRLQALCARGAKVSTRRVEAKISGPASGSTLGPRVRASTRCSGGGYALGSPLSQEYSPGRGPFSSIPDGSSGWKVEDSGVPASFPLQSQPPAYASVACLSKSSLKSVTRVSESTTALGPGASTAKLAVRCTGGRRALTWGVELRPFSTARSAPSTGGWGTPFLRRAQLSKSAVNFTFELPAGAQLVTASTQTAHVVCGKPR